jgi:hypothetical protein
VGLETGTYIDSLNAANPTATDPKSEGDDHLRLLKSTIKSTLPNVTGAVTATHTELNILDGVTATTAELNWVDGVTSNIQTQINNLDPLPSQTGHSGKYLTTDATNASWATLDTDANSTTKGLYEMKNTIGIVGTPVTYVIGTGNNALSAGPITIESGSSVTIPTGSTWVIA